MTYFERLAARSREINSLVCVGLDPDFKRHAVEERAQIHRLDYAPQHPCPVRWW